MVVAANAEHDFPVMACAHRTRCSSQVTEPLQDGDDGDEVDKAGFRPLQSAGV